MKAINRKKLIRLFILLLIISTIFFLPLIYVLSKELSVTERVKGNVLLVEGWLPAYAMKMAYSEYNNGGYEYIFTTGLTATPEYFAEYSDGYLIFNTKNILSSYNKQGVHIIEIKAYGSLNDQYMANFNVFINDSLVSNFFADKRKQNFVVKWIGRLSKIDSITIQLLNDQSGEFGDVNLFVKEIEIDHKLVIPYQMNSKYLIYEPDRTIEIRNDYLSYAQHARNSLIALGIDSSRVISIPGNKVAINRTLTSALAVRDWIRQSNIKITGINIVTLGTHAKRTWMTYNRMLKKKYKIGIISIPDFRDRRSIKHKILKTLRETLGVLYYWLILIPY